MDNEEHRYDTDPVSQKNLDNFEYPTALQVILNAAKNEEREISLDPRLQGLDPNLPVCLSQSSEPTVPLRVKTTSVGDFILL